jgi:DNA-directed RNA polymerase subunit K/omega
MAQYISRGTKIDTEACVALSGGNRFNLVIMAAARSREIRRQHKESQKFEHVHTTVTALLEFQEGKYDSEYLKRIKLNDPRDRRIDHGANSIGR